MADESIEVSLDLAGSFRSAIDAAAASTDALASDFADLSRAVGKLDGKDVLKVAKAAKKGEAALDSMGGAADEAAGDVEDVGASADEAASRFDAMSAAATGLATAAFDALISKISEASGAFFEFAGANIEGQRTARNVYATLTKGQGNFGKFSELAKNMGVSVMDLAEDFREFAKLDIDINAAQKLAILKADLEAFGGENFAADAMAQITEQINNGVAPADAMASTLKKLRLDADQFGTGAHAAARATQSMGGAWDKLKSTVGNQISQAFASTSGSGKSMAATINELAASQDFQSFLQGTIALLGGLAAAGMFVVSAIGGMGDNLRAIGVMLGQSWGEATASMSASLSSIGGKVSSFLSDVAAIPGKIASKAGEWASAGVDLVMGFVNGIKGAIGSALDAVTELGSQATEKLKSYLKISSPSKVFLELGSEVTAGFAAGITPVDDIGERLAPSLPVANDVTPAAGGGLSGGTFEITINVTGASDPSDTAMSVRDALDEYLSGIRLSRGVA